MGIGNIEYGTPIAISSSQNVMPVDGVVRNIFVSSASNTPTITVYDSATTTTTNTVLATFTPTGPANYDLHLYFTAGCYIAIGGTVSLTANVIPG